MIGFRNGRDEGASFARQSFFLLDSQVIRIFCLKDHLIILRAVTYVICGRMCSRATMDQPGNYWLTIFLEMAVMSILYTRFILMFYLDF